MLPLFGRDVRKFCDRKGVCPFLFQLLDEILIKGNTSLEIVAQNCTGINMRLACITIGGLDFIKQMTNLREFIYPRISVLDKTL